MVNQWTQFVKQFASDNSLSYACALSTPACKEQYRAKYGVAKKLTKKQNLEKMSAEDMDAPNIKMVVKEKKKRKPKAELVIEEEPEETMEIMVKKPKKVKAVIPIRDKNKDYGGREQLLETFDVKTLRKFLKDNFDYVASPQLTKKELVLDILLAEAGLPIKY
jgi:hypothetical protein